MKYIGDHGKPTDGKIHAVGHSMGGILIYALIASQSEDLLYFFGLFTCDSIHFVLHRNL